MEKKRKHELMLWGGILGGGLLVWFFLTQHSSTQGKSGGRSSPQTVPNPANATIEQQLISARETALGLYDQSSVQERSIASQQAIAFDETAAQKAIAFNQDATALKAVGITTAAQQAIAQIQAQTAQAAISAQQNIASQQQSNSWWQSILGFVGGIFGFNASSPGFSFPGLFPVGQGTGEVNYLPDLYAPQGPASWDIPYSGG